MVVVQPFQSLQRWSDAGLYLCVAFVTLVASWVMFSGSWHRPKAAGVLVHWQFVIEATLYCRGCARQWPEGTEWLSGSPATVPPGGVQQPTDTTPVWPAGRHSVCSVVPSDSSSSCHAGLQPMLVTVWAQQSLRPSAYARCCGCSIASASRQ